MLICAGPTHGRHASKHVRLGCAVRDCRGLAIAHEDIDVLIGVVGHKDMLAKLWKRHLGCTCGKRERIDAIGSPWLPDSPKLRLTTSNVWRSMTKASPSTHWVSPGTSWPVGARDAQEAAVRTQRCVELPNGRLQSRSFRPEGRVTPRVRDGRIGRRRSTPFESPGDQVGTRCSRNSTKLPIRGRGNGLLEQRRFAWAPW
jgi:hypothetical protein